jgi:hypothetical protein
VISIKQVLSFVISITLTRVNLDQNNLMGQQWRVAIHPPGKGLLEERIVFGRRKQKLQLAQ